MGGPIQDIGNAAERDLESDYVDCMKKTDLERASFGSRQLRDGIVTHCDPGTTNHAELKLVSDR